MSQANPAPSHDHTRSIEASVSKAGEFRFRCPICASHRQLSFTPPSGYHILCGGCLGVLVVTGAKPKAKPKLGIRAITHGDVERMANDVQLAILAAKTRRLRVRIEAGEVVYERTG